MTTGIMNDMYFAGEPDSGPRLLNYTAYYQSFHLIFGLHHDAGPTWNGSDTAPSNHYIY